MPRTLRSILRTGVWLLLAVTISSLLVACGAGEPTAPKPPLRVEYTDWEGDYTLLIAKEKGLFDKYGVQVEPVYYQNFSEAVPDMAAGKLDGSLVGMFDALNIANLTDTKAVAVYDSGGTYSLVAAPDISKVEDLKGKSIGVTFGSSAEMILRNALKEAGMTTKDVVIQNLDVSEMVDYMPKNIQAAVIYEPYTTQAVQKGFPVILSSQDSALLPDLIFFNSRIAEQRPEEIKAFLRAWFEAVDYRLAHPEESKQIISKITGTPENELISGDAQLFTLEDNRTLFNTASSVKKSIYDIATISLDFLTNMGSLTTRLDLKKLFDPAFLPDQAGALLNTAIVWR
jgi:NitT/TauT family transport system substrate-binding protein